MSKKAIVVIMVVIGVLAMGALYVFVGSNVLKRVPKTEVVQSTPANEAQPLTPTVTDSAPPKALTQPASNPASHQITPESTSASTNPPVHSNEGQKSSSGLRKKLRNLVSFVHRR